MHRFPVDLSLLRTAAHSPTVTTLTRSMQRPDLALRDYCIPVNPYFPTPRVWERLNADLGSALKFYPSSNGDLAANLAAVLGLDPQTVVVANGSTELITWMDWLFVAESIAVPVPTFGRWTDQPAETGKAVFPFFRRAADDYRIDVDELVAHCLRHRVRSLALCNPNNPTGTLLSPADVGRLCDALAHLDLIVIDESFIDFADEGAIPSVAAQAPRRSNLVVMKSLGKNLGLHGVRLGYAVTNVRLAARLRKALPPWNVNAIGELLIRLLGEHIDEYEASRRRVVRDREYLRAALEDVGGLHVYPSRGNFVFVRMPDDVDGLELRDALLVDRGLFVRECGNKLGSDKQHFRIAARPTAEVDALSHGLRETLAQLRPHTRIRAAS